VDAAKDDIVLSATSGNLNLTGAIAGINNVRLVQRNKLGVAGKIGGPSRILAKSVEVEAEGSVDIRTDVVTLAGRAGGGFAIDEANDILVTSLRAPGLVSLRAGGVDPGEGNPLSTNQIALKAQLEDVTSLEASALRGSIEIVSNTAKLLTLGDAARVGQGKAASLQAAGGVSIRSTAGPIVVADAPLGGGSALAVRVATTLNLAGAYSQLEPGRYASTLTGSNVALKVDGVALRVGDRVLLAGQSKGLENGLYTVTASGSSGRPWVLTRAADADTSAEFTPNTLVRVAEGSAAGNVFVIGYSSSTGASPLAVTAVSNRADARPVAVATTTALAVTYNSLAGTLTGAAALPAIDGVVLGVGDLVLVKNQADRRENGIYEVSVTGPAWQMTRASDVDTDDLIQTGCFFTTKGSYRAAVTGQAFLVAYDSLGVDAMTVTEVEGGRPRTDIGTEDVNDTTTFVVSSTAGTNDAAGSLGKMLSLMLANDTSGSERNPNQKTGFAFASSLPGLNGASAGVIRLTQELPVISKAFAIDGAARVQVAGATGAVTKNIVIDGSRITTTRLGQSAAIAPEVNGFEFLPGSSAVPGTAGASLADLTVGGFARGSAVKVNGSYGVLVKNATIGRNETGDRLANKFGALVTGAGGTATLLNSRIVGSTQAGIRVDNAVARAIVVGSTIGATNQANGVGIELLAGYSQIGLTPLPSKLPTVRVNIGSPVFQFNAPAAVLNSLFVGQTVNGNGIANGTTIAAIHGATITMSKAATGTATTNVRFGLPTRNVIEQNLTGVLLGGGTNVVVNNDIGSNVYDGIKISGTAPVGTQYVGTSSIVSSQSNAIYNNGGAGVNVTGGRQTIVGNVFGARGANRGKNVLVNGVEPPEYKPLNARLTQDRWGNTHAPASGAAGSRRVTWRG
jgi:hypothetical protein